MMRVIGISNISTNFRIFLAMMNIKTIFIIIDRQAFRAYNILNEIITISGFQ